jgi:tetratricopeptide (TPR) repeat protein
MRAFPARLPQQPIFYPVLQLEYARQIAFEWNAKSRQAAGYVTKFTMDDSYIDQFEKHTVGSSQHQEFWIPAEDLEKFNQHIIGDIKVLEAYFGDAFEGFIPEKFGLQGKNAIEQFTLLANSYMYKRMDFYLEIRRNHKAIFLNYLFWQKYEFKNPGLKEKILQAIREAWLKSSPKIPLPLPPSVSEGTPLPQPIDSSSSADPVEEEITTMPVEENDLYLMAKPVEEDSAPVEPTDSNPPVNLVEEEINSVSLVNPAREVIKPVKQTNSHVLINPRHGKIVLPIQVKAHFLQGIEQGLSGKYHEAIDELSKAAEEDPSHVVTHTSLGVAFHRLGKDQRALSCYETALKLDPIYAEAYYFRANILYSHGRVREAIAGYTMAIGLKPELIESHQKPIPQDRLTDYTGSPAEMYRIAKPARRILDLNKLFESNPQQADLFKERAAEYYRLRNYVQAIVDYSSYLAIQPEDARGLHLRGVAYEQLGQIERALQDYQRAIAIDPQLSNDYIQRGITFGKRGNYRQSVASLTEAIRLAPRNPDGYFNRGTSYFQLGDLEAAIADFSMAIRLSSDDEDAYYWRGISNEEAGHQQAAIADYRRFLAISQNARAREEIEQRLDQWNERQQNAASIRGDISADGQETNQSLFNEIDQNLDLHSLLVTLGERAHDSTWFGSGVHCYGEKADELHTLTDQDQPIEGRTLLHITSGIHQTLEGDFRAFDPDAPSPWIFIRAWNGSGFYVETNDVEVKQRLLAHFPVVEDVEGAQSPYLGLFLPI